MLKKLAEAFGPSGCESEVQNIIKDFMTDFCDEMYTDNMGNLICHKFGKKVDGKSIMLSAHTDEVGFIITYITEDGYLKFSTVGGIDPKVLVSKKILVGKNKISGVIGSVPPHHRKDSDNIKISDLYIDIGATSREDALKYVSKGDYACFDSEYVEFGNNLVKCKALDDRVGCYIMIKTAQMRLDADIYYTFTVQEEVGCRGSKITAKKINPAFAIVIEGTTCSDVPGTDEYGFSTKLGKGPALSMRDGGAYADVELTENIYKTALNKNIKCQYKRTTLGGNDASSIQVTAFGNKVAAVSVPCRYIHSQSNVASVDDINNAVLLIKEFIESRVNRND